MVDSIGFLSVRSHEEHGYFGGYLVVNPLGRPLEFHCTMPVKPSRAQALLYGATMDDFVCGEQIAKALVAKAKLKPGLLLTDGAAVLSLGVVSSVCLAWLDARDTTSQSSLSMPNSNARTGDMLAIGDYRFHIPAGSGATEQMLKDTVAGLAPSFELQEPFQRIVDALLEAHPIAKAA